MTDKQIIIDGVDVSGCEYFRVTLPSGCLGEHRCNCDSINSMSLNCEDNNCIYKQLKRKEQECENGIKRIKDLEERIINHSDTIEEYCNKLAKKQQECERLKKKLNPKLKNAHCAYFEGQTGLCKAKEFTRCNPVNCKLYTIDELSTIVDLQEQLDQLKAELEQMTALKDTYFACYHAKHGDLAKKYDQLKAENDELKNKNNDLTILGMDLNQTNEILRKSFFTADKNKDNWREKAEKLKQTLTEIKEIAEKSYKTPLAEKDCINCDEFLAQILQKISEVE